MLKHDNNSMEKLRTLRKQRGYTQEYMSKILSTDVSNYSRKESGDVRIFDDEWEKLAKALDVPVEDIKEEKAVSVVQNNDNSTFSDNAVGVNYNNNYYSIPDYLLESQQDYINLLKKEIETLSRDYKQGNKSLLSYTDQLLHFEQFFLSQSFIMQIGDFKKAKRAINKLIG